MTPALLTSSSLAREKEPGSGRCRKRTQTRWLRGGCFFFYQSSIFLAATLTLPPALSSPFHTMEPFHPWVIPVQLA